MEATAVLKQITRGGFLMELRQAGLLIGYAKTNFNSGIPGIDYLKTSPVGNHLQVKIKRGRTRYRILKVLGPLTRPSH